MNTPKNGTASPKQKPLRQHHKQTVELYKQIMEEHEAQEGWSEVKEQRTKKIVWTSRSVHVPQKLFKHLSVAPFLCVLLWFVCSFCAQNLKEALRNYLWLREEWINWRLSHSLNQLQLDLKRHICLLRTFMGLTNLRLRCFCIVVCRFWVVSHAVFLLSCSSALLLFLLLHFIFSCLILSLFFFSLVD